MKDNKTVPTVILDDPKGRDALRKAQSAPVHVETPGGDEGYLVSKRTMELIRKRLMAELADNMQATGTAAEAAGFSEDDIKAIFPDDAGE